jgi:hypothetical protein
MKYRLLVKKNNSFLVKRNGVQFSSEAGNLLNKNSFKYSGIANKKVMEPIAPQDLDYDNMREN